MKTCPICGTFNSKDNYYCTHCGCKVMIENICPFCGQKNPDENEFCLSCHKQITPIVIDSFDVLFSDYNRMIILTKKFSVDDYFNVLNNIFKKLDYVNLSERTAKEKILKIANTFTRVIPKSDGVVYGEFGSSVIFYDDRLDDSIQISTIIHELAHFLLFDIVLNVLCELLSVKSSAVLKSFVEFVLTQPELEVINEYCAHTVENRFIPLKFQNFKSFEKCINDLNLSYDDYRDFMIMGNSFAKNMIIFLDKYIDEKLRELIKLQFKKDGIVVKEVISYSINDYFSPEENIKYFIGLMALYFEDLLNNEEAREELEYIKGKFEN